MRIAAAILAVALSGPAFGQRILVLPPPVEDVAKAHHCDALSSFVTDEESSEAAPFDFRYESVDPPKFMLAAWCIKAENKAKGAYTLLVWASRPDHPLRTCPAEITNVAAIGRPEMDAAPLVPHDFILRDTGQRLPVREPRMMFGVRNHLRSGKDFYACVAGRWAHYAPEKR
jgi:hypothetical protein